MLNAIVDTLYMITTFKGFFKEKVSIDTVVQYTFYVLAVLLLACYSTQLLVAFAIDYQQVFPRNMSFFMMFLRWFTTLTVGLAVTTAFFGGYRARSILSVFAIVVGILNLVFYENNMIAWGMNRETLYSADNGFAYCSWRAAFFIVEQVLMILVGITSVVTFIRKKDYKSFKFIDILWIPLIIGGLMLCYFYEHFFENYHTITNTKMKDWETSNFSTSHLIFLMMVPVIIFTCFFIFRKRTEQEKRFFLAVMALGSSLLFLSNRLFDSRGGIYTGSIPVHICNLAPILLAIAFFFKWKPLFYFTFFVSVIGTTFAMILPDKDYLALSFNSIHYWINHIVVFVAPILAVTLGIFERPKLKDTLAAIIIFAFYFLFAATMNALFTANGHSANYFFLNDDFYLDKVKWYDCPLRDPEYQWTIHVGDLDLLFYPAYHSLIFVIFILVIFLLWYIYDLLFYIADNHKHLHIKKMLKKEGYLELKKLLKGRSIKEPLYKEGVGMIEIKDFTKIYAGSTKPSVNHLSLTIKDGEVYGFLGHNGAGKSTTIKSLVGIQSITEGKMIINGYDITKQPVEAKLQIGYVSDNHAVYEKLTGREYINYIADLYMVSKEDREERINKYLKMFNLEEAIDREAKSYSHGMKQKLVVIASLIHDPKVWILDEPLTGLDPTSSHQIKECMKEHASRGNIVFFSSHVIEVVEKICTRICIISHGELMCEYSLKELQKKGIALEDLYLKYVSGEEGK